MNVRMQNFTNLKSYPGLVFSSVKNGTFIVWFDLLLQDSVLDAVLKQAYKMFKVNITNSTIVKIVVLCITIVNGE